MMIDLTLGLALILLFYLLGRSADLVVLNARFLAEKLGVRIFVLGLLLGSLTSLPEFSIGVNAAINQHDALSYGNLIGGLIVLFGLVLGISIVLNRKIQTDGKGWLIMMVGAACLAPMYLGLDGSLTSFDGGLLLVIYASVLGLILRHSQPKNSLHFEISQSGQLWRHAGLIGAGLIGVLVSSNLLVKTTLYLLRHFDVPEFVIGLLVFSVGTNLPEIIVAVRSWKRHIKELSMSNLIGSVLTNTLIVGLLALAKTIQVDLHREFYLAFAVSALIFITVAIFYRSGKQMVRLEGFALLAVYFSFVAVQIWLAIKA